MPIDITICLTQDVQTKVTDIVLGKDKPIEESDPDYEKLKHYIFELEDHLTEAQKQSFRLAKRHRGSFLYSRFVHFEKLQVSAINYLLLHFPGDSHIFQS